MTEQTQEQAEVVVEDATTEQTVEVENGTEEQQVETAEESFNKTGNWPEETPGWVKKAVSKSRQRKNDAIAKAEAAKREADYWRNKAQEAPAPQQVDGLPPKPTREQFEFDDDKYLDALTDWKIDTREATRQAQQTAKKREEEEYSQLTTFEQKRENTVNTGREKYQDFDDVVFSLPADVLTQQLANAIFETDAPDEVSYFLGKNPDKAVEIAQLSPMRQAVELGRIEGIMKVQKKEPTNAPPPIKPLGASGSVEKTPATMSDSEYRAWSFKNRRQR